MMVTVEVSESWVARYKLTNKSYYQDRRDCAAYDGDSKTFTSQKECDEWVYSNQNKCSKLTIVHTKEIK